MFKAYLHSQNHNTSYAYSALLSPSLLISILPLQILCFIAHFLLPSPITLLHKFHNSTTKGVPTSHAAVPMAAPPVKSQPLHNFSLPHLKWAHKSSSPSTLHHHRFRRRDSPDQHPNPKQQPPSETNPVSPEENGDAKPWKLRPRREVAAAAAVKRETGGPSNDCKVKSQRLRGMGEGGQQDGGGGERMSKRKIWISLSREEIEEDVYALTGGKPNRRPKKWPKNVQKQLDNVFPGLYLVGVAADSYTVMML